MALYKKITLDNGQVVCYHRITSITNECDKILVSIDSYTDLSYRQLEKTNCANQANLEKYIEKRNTLMELYQKNNDETLIKSINDMDNMISNIPINFNINNVIKSTEIEISKNSSISFNNIYETLKQTEMFSGAKDIMD